MDQPTSNPPVDHQAAQTRLLSTIAEDIATLRKIAMFGMFLVGAGVVVFLLSLLGAS